MNIYPQLNEVFQQVFEDQSIRLTPETTADNIEGWDSFSHVNLMMAVEMKFGINFTMREMLNFANVGELLSCIEQKLAQK